MISSTDLEAPVPKISGRDVMDNLHKHSVEAHSETSNGVCVITRRELNVSDIISLVSDNKAGGTAVFIGTTRDHFNGKTVKRLEYQAYSKLAIKVLDPMHVTPY